MTNMTKERAGLHRIVKFKTNDGEEFESEEKAIEHDKWLEFKKAVEKQVGRRGIDDHTLRCVFSHRQSLHFHLNDLPIPDPIIVPPLPAVKVHTPLWVHTLILGIGSGLGAYFY